MKILKKIRYNSPVVLTFALLSLLVLILDFLTGGFTTYKLFCVYRFYPFDVFGYIRLFGHVLGHSGIGHYIGNITLMLVIGPLIEERYGSRKLICAIAVTAAVSGLIHCAVSPDTYLLGASGIVFMMIILSSFSLMKDGEIPLTAILVAIIYIGGEIIEGVASYDNVSHLTHIIGGVCGGVFGYAAGKRDARTGSERKENGGF